MDTITLTIDGCRVQVAKGSTVLEAARLAGINIPTLCYHPELRSEGACRLCVVEIKGGKSLAAACVMPAADGMEVRTNTPFVREARRTALELLLANHPFECLTCERSGNCELQTLAHDLGVREVRYTGEKRSVPIDDSGQSLVRDPNKCILCGRCIRMCSEVQGVHALGYINRGWDTLVGPLFGQRLADVACVNCGQCSTVCPTGAIVEKSYVEDVWAALGDPNKYVVVQTAPATRVAVGETLGMSPGSIVTGQMVAGLRRLGFDKVFDTDFTADLTIMEEGYELLERLKNGGALPLLTSCSPGWVKFCEHVYPELLSYVSTCKSPQQMFGAVAKTYYADKIGVKPEDMYVVSIMPCTAKKYEAQRPEMTASGVPDVDAVLTSRELGRMFKEAGIDFKNLPQEDYDAPLGISTGAGVIFGATGGVMEAALRTVYEVVTGKTLDALDFTEVRGLDGIKEAEVDLDGTKVKVAVTNSLANARKVLDKIKTGEAPWHFVEIMACPGGCIGGGGQPIPVDRETREARMKAIYDVDKAMSIRKSHENPAVQTLYKEFLGEPLSHKSHELLHTYYTERSPF
ncbi:MAG: NADH-dependent [FeFe] hydrogenase, group A6 [bacterium]|jgi:NADP-reducing hydrogenase subunit HndD